MRLSTLSLIGVPFLITMSSTTTYAADRPTEPFRKEHVEVKKHLERTAALVGKLDQQNAEQRKKTMNEVVSFFQKEIKPHAEWEEKTLYPAVDKRAAKGEHPFTASMRYEHKIVGRWIGELDRESRQSKPDAVAFARRADNLIGLISAHFEEEEEVLLPILDRTLTVAEFEQEIMKKAEHGGAEHAGEEEHGAEEHKSH